MTPALPLPLRFTVCTCNIWTWTRWPERRDALRAFADLHRPDIFCVHRLRSGERGHLRGATPPFLGAVAGARWVRPDPAGLHWTWHGHAVALESEKSDHPGPADGARSRTDDRLAVCSRAGAGHDRRGRRLLARGSRAVGSQARVGHLRARCSLRPIDFPSGSRVVAMALPSVHSVVINPDEDRLVPNADHLFDRELSWLAFNERVLTLAGDRALPLVLQPGDAYFEELVEVGAEDGAERHSLQQPSASSPRPQTTRRSLPSSSRCTGRLATGRSSNLSFVPSGRANRSPCSSN